MKAVIQRVGEASVGINGREASAIGKGMLVLLGIEHEDGPDDVEWLVGKIVRLRIFPDDNDVMNRSVQDVQGEMLVVSQFTLHASTKKGNRPSYIQSAGPDKAVPLYESFIQKARDLLGRDVKSGRFGADMKVSLLNDGPVTIIIDSKNKV